MASLILRTGGKTPMAEKPPVVTDPVRQETSAQLAKRMVLEAGVPLDLFAAEVASRNIAKDVDSWPDFDAVPIAVWEVLGAQQKTLSTLIKKFGKKSE